MAIVPNVKDPNYKNEIKRMYDIANGPEGKDRMAKEFNIDMSKGGGKISPEAQKTVDAAGTAAADTAAEQATKSGKK